MKNLQIFLLLILLAGCATATVSPTPANTLPVSGTQSYPAPSQQVSAATSYPLATAVLASQPAQNPNMAQVEGTLLLKGNPVTPADLWLIDLIKNDKGTEVAAQFDRNINIKANTDSSGKFIFVNVKPGRYTLMIEYYPMAYLLLKPDKNEALIVDVAGTGTTSMGTLNYSTLPGPNK
jgi:hypothetical protein